MCFLYFFRGFSWFQAFLCLIWALNSHQTMPRPPRLDIYNKKNIRTKFWQHFGALVIYSWKVLSPPRGQNTQKSFRRNTSEITQIGWFASFWGPLTYMDLTGLCFHARLAIDSKTVLTGTHFTHSKHTFKSRFTHWQTVANRGLMMPARKTQPPLRIHVCLCFYFRLHLQHLPSIPYLYVYSLKKCIHFI